MKKCLIFLGILLASVVGANAQTVVFEDDFESYEIGTNLADEGYVIWEGGATVQYDGETTNKLADCNPSNNNFYFRRSFTLEEGKSYTFEVSTKSPGEKNHRIVAKVGDRNVQSELINAAEWTKTTLNFTVGAGETNVIFWIYSYPISAVHIDNFKLIDDVGTSSQFKEMKESSVRIFPNPTKGELQINHDTKILSLRIYTISGKLIEVFNDLNQMHYTLDLKSYKRGTYFVTLVDDKEKSHTEKVVVK